MTDSVRSIDRCFDVLEMMMESDRDFSPAEISRKLAAPESTVLTIVRTLAAHNFDAADTLVKDWGPE